MSAAVRNVQTGQGWWQPPSSQCDGLVTELALRLLGAGMLDVRRGHGWWQPPVVRCDGDVTQVWRALR